MWKKMETFPVSVVAQKPITFLKNLPLLHLCALLDWNDIGPEAQKISAPRRNAFVCFALKAILRDAGNDRLLQRRRGPQQSLKSIRVRPWS
jgi:hypothetical protein